MNDETTGDIKSDHAPVKRDRNEFRHCPPDRHRVRLHLSYDGTEFHGWQRQTDSAGNTTLVTAQGTIEAAVKQIFGEKLAVVGASRTDAGVHAQMQVAHFDCKRDPTTFKDLRYSLQSLTPETLVIKDAFLAPRDFHAIATSIDKTYRYSILNRRVPSALRHRTSWWIREPIDLDLLNEASQYLIGRHDFKSFQTSGTYVESTTRTLKKAFWRRAHPGESGVLERGSEIGRAISNQLVADESKIVKRNRIVAESDDTLVFEIQGEGFLKQMVRNIVGTLVDLQLGRRPAKDIKTILEALDRRKAGNTADPQGLFLTEVRYPVELDNRCHPL
jgi:tRNA pseudouridine38-40 synthase